jgi:hypothetical protein
MTRIILKLIAWLVRQGLSIVLLSIPWIWKALNFTFLLVATSVGSLRLGVPKTIRKMADEWLTRAIKAGLPPSWESFIYKGSFVLAVLTVLAGWAVLAFTTVFIVRSLF